MYDNSTFLSFSQRFASLFFGCLQLEFVRWIMLTKLLTGYQLDV
jgi:hypothetical protein